MDFRLGSPIERPFKWLLGRLYFIFEKPRWKIKGRPRSTQAAPFRHPWLISIINLSWYIIAQWLFNDLCMSFIWSCWISNSYFCFFYCKLQTGSGEFLCFLKLGIKKEIYQLGLNFWTLSLWVANPPQQKLNTVIIFRLVWNPSVFFCIQ